MWGKAGEALEPLSGLGEAWEAHSLQLGGAAGSAGHTRAPVVALPNSFCRRVCDQSSTSTPCTAPRLQREQQSGHLGTSSSHTSRTRRRQSHHRTIRSPAMSAAMRASRLAPSAAVSAASSRPAALGARAPFPAAVPAALRRRRPLRICASSASLPLNGATPQQQAPAGSPGVAQPPASSGAQQQQQEPGWFSDAWKEAHRKETRTVGAGLFPRAGPLARPLLQLLLPLLLCPGPLLPSTPSAPSARSSAGPPPYSTAQPPKPCLAATASTYHPAEPSCLPRLLSLCTLP